MSQKFEVTSGKLILSDPCYELGTWCQGTVENVKKGTWVADTVISDEGGWGNRVSMLVAYNEESANGSFGLSDKLKALYGVERLSFDGGVDSGQFGYFDAETFRNDESAKDLHKYVFRGEADSQEDAWYRACCHLTLGDNQWGVLPQGVVSSSGFGDGSYPTYCIKDFVSGEIIGLVTVFIGEDEEEDEEEEWDDED